MTTGIEELKPFKKRTGRGPSKRPTLVCTSLRLPRDVMDYFDKAHPYSKQAKMREILMQYVQQQTGAINDD